MYKAGRHWSIKILVCILKNLLLGFVCLLFGFIFKQMYDLASLYFSSRSRFIMIISFLWWCTSGPFSSVLLVVPSANVKIKVRRKLFPCIVNMSLDFSENEESNPKRA